MNQFPESSVITAVSNRPFKGTLDATASRTAAQTVVIALRIGGKNPFPANRADVSARRMNGLEAIRTDRQARDIQQRQSADAAVGRK